MMLAQLHVGLSKKGVSQLITVIAFVLVAMSAFVVLSVFTNQFVSDTSIEENCIDYLKFSIEDACYLNDNEVKVGIKRGSDDLNVGKIRFEFSPSLATWELSGKKCLDARLEDREYGGYCEIMGVGETFFYVFDVNDLDVQSSVFVSAGNGNLCEIGEEEIKSSC